MIGRLRSPVV